MFVFVRALTYASLFIGFLLVFVPRAILSPSGLEATPVFDLLGLFGALLTALGAALALWCILSFVIQGKGTPAPFDPPRRLVVAGPYRFVRNPMYLGATAALLGAALVYRSWPLAVYGGVFVGALHLFVVGYEEPALRHLFGADYQTYCAEVSRWRPKAFLKP